GVTDGRARSFLRIYGAAVYVFLYTPIVMLIVLSFNDSNSITLPWGGFTWRWYRALADNQSVFVSLKNSLTLRLMTAVISTGIVGSALFAFTLSFDEFIRTLFTIGNDNTLPIQIWSTLGSMVSQELNAMATLIVAASFALVIAGELLRGRER